MLNRKDKKNERKVLTLMGINFSSKFFLLFSFLFLFSLTFVSSSDIYENCEIYGTCNTLDSINIFLNDLDDVVVPSPLDGEVLYWNDSNSQWESKTIGDSGGNISGYGTGNFVPLWTDTDTLGDSGIYKDGSYYKIGGVNLLTGYSASGFAVPFFTTASGNYLSSESDFTYSFATNTLNIDNINIEGLIFDGTSILSSTTGTSTDSILASKGYVDDEIDGIDTNINGTHINITSVEVTNQIQLWNDSESMKIYLDENGTLTIN